MTGVQTCALPIYLTTRNDPFFSLCRTIIGQQISTKAADSIWLKFEIKCKKKIIPKTVLKLTSRSLRNAGLSRQKINYLKNIAKSFKNKSFNIGNLKKMNDDLAIDYITQLKGLGVWSGLMVVNILVSSKMEPLMEKLRLLWLMVMRLSANG